MKPRVEVCFDHKKRRAFLRQKPICEQKSNEFLLNHARSGLLLALRSLGLPQGSRVGVMVYNCHTVMNAVDQAGLEIVFVDVDDDMRINAEDLRNKADGMKVLIVTHLFGIVNDVKDIRRRYPHLVVIEDCAHAYGKEIDGDFGVYSIGQGKLPSLGDGGILVVNNSQYIEAVRSLYDRLPCYSRFDETKLYVKLFLTDVLHKRLIYSVFTSRWKQNKKPQSGRETIVMKKMSPGVQAMFALSKKDIPNQVKTRLVNAEKEADYLKDNVLVSSVLVGSNVFMVVARSADVKALKAQYAQRGIETATHFAHSIHWACSFGYKGDCPNAEKSVKELLMIPIY